MYNFSFIKFGIINCMKYINIAHIFINYYIHHKENIKNYIKEVKIFIRYVKDLS